MNSNDLTIKIKRIRKLEKENRLQEASELASDLALTFPHAFDIQFMAGKLMHDLGDIDTGAFHLELASANLTKGDDGFINFTDLSAIMGLLARCAKPAAAKAVWARHYSAIDFENINLDTAKQITDVLTVLEMHDESLTFLNECYQNFDNEEDFTEFLIMMARIFHATDDIKSEFEVFELALKTDPFNDRLHNKVANFLSRIKAYDLASDHIKFIQTLNPDYKYKSIAQDFFAVSKSGSFEEQERIKNYWLDNPDEPQDSKAPFSTLLLIDDPEFLHNDVLQFADWTQLVKGKKRRTERLPAIEPPNGRKIRVGYVSPDFRNHAVCHLVTDLIDNHDRQEFEVFGYGISYFDNSEYRQRIISKFDEFKSLENANTQEVIRAIEADQLDICVDLCGYTTGMMGTLFNRLNGPILVNYLGFPGTLGHPQYDYIIGDPIVTPPETDKFFSENVIRIDC
jgi:predicted O-linked N-acetylglucosamine transferase (SPINDLY family)